MVIISKSVACIFTLITSASLTFAQLSEKDYAFANYRKYDREARKSNDAEKEKAIAEYRHYYSTTPYSPLSSSVNISVQECMKLLDVQGRFTDAPTVAEAYNRLWKIAEACRTGVLSRQAGFSNSYRQAILHYGNMEISRPNNSSRWHESCFALPTAAAHIYFCFLNEMDDVESGRCTHPQQTAVCDLLKVIALQSWTQPLRNDSTDNDVVQEARFRHHVWWVGGNAVGYRPLFLCALMYRSVPMIDLIADVCLKSLSTVSQNTYNDAFWNEGFTADGAGWGHGKQCLIWGYPIDGTGNALKILSILNPSPWKKTLSQPQAQALLHFFRGGNWYYYKGYILPCLDRNSARYYEQKSRPIPYQAMLKNVLSEWIDAFTPNEQAELQQLYREVQNNAIEMANYPDGMYSGTRWFYNNDDLIKKNNRYHLIINMASSRCDGLESAAFNDEYNFFTNDGLTLFQRTGHEYRTVIGAWDVTASPGITARQGMPQITPITNWRGYCSKHNFAGAATFGGENAVAGFLFEKKSGENKDDTKREDVFYQKNPMIYDVKACKSYFILGDYMVALGAGVANLDHNQRATIRTTIDQTAQTAPVFKLKADVPEPVSPGVHSLTDRQGIPFWVSQQGGFSYRILPEYSKQSYFVTETKRNEWVNRNKSNASIGNLPTEADILRLWIDHGAHPQADTYGYTVYCGEGFPRDELPFQVFRNDTLIQAVGSKDLTIVEAVCYRAGEYRLAENVYLKVSAPAVVLIEDTGHGYRFSVNDPTMNTELKQVTVSFNDIKVSINIPQGEEGGKPELKTAVRRTKEPRL